MSRILFTSDLHIGSKFVAKVRKFTSVDQHDDFIINRLCTQVSNRDTLYILGDIANKIEHLQRLNEVKCQTKIMVMGNHDNLSIYDYLSVFDDVKGFHSKYHFWISHAPVHEQEIINKYGNIHGHVHDVGLTDSLGKPWFNVNIDCNDYNVVSLDDIRKSLPYKIPLPLEKV